MATSRPSYLAGKTDAFVQSADVWFEVDGQLFPAHSVMIRSQSRLLEGLLAGRQARPQGMSNLAWAALATIKLGGAPQAAQVGITAADFELFLRHAVYSPHDPIQSERDAKRLLFLADYFQVEGLFPACDAALVGFYDPTSKSWWSWNLLPTVTERARLASHYKLPALMGQCIVAVVHFAADGDWCFCDKVMKEMDAGVRAALCEVFIKELCAARPGDKGRERAKQLNVRSKLLELGYRK